MTTRFNQFGHLFGENDWSPRIYGGDFRFADMSSRIHNILTYPANAPGSTQLPSMTHSYQADTEPSPAAANVASQPRIIEWLRGVGNLFNLTRTQP